MLKTGLISFAYSQSAYTMLLHDFEKRNKMLYSEDSLRVAMVELIGEGYLEGEIIMSRLTGEGIKAAQKGYVTYSEGKEEEAIKDKLFSRRMNWTILLISALSLIVSILALFR
ncbi:MAG: hypothetical protein K0S33_1953 [Bacteroidetes bacterium]|nr:hypothetical protein [Bacteroidota bacterium]